MKYISISVAALCISIYATHALSDSSEGISPTEDLLNQADHTMSNPNSSPVRRIERNHNKYKKKSFRNIL